LNDFFFARSQMGMSLAFHIVFTVIGMAMLLLMALSEKLNEIISAKRG
jgi:cytochrome bd ubiquinol oxidase subunit I